MPLRVLIDGTPVADPEARTLWQRFSAWMEEHKGDLAGFARAEGFASVHPELHDGEPVLIASRSTPQQPYDNAPSKHSRRSPAQSSQRRRSRR